MVKLFIRSCFESMEILSKHQSSASYHLPYYYLAQAILELCPKLILISKLEGEGLSGDNIKKELMKYGHDLEKLFSNVDIKSKYNQVGGIKVTKVTEENKNFYYEFETFSPKKKIMIYDSESLKYGLLSNKVNISYVGYQFNDLLELCSMVSDASFIK